VDPKVRGGASMGLGWYVELFDWHESVERFPTTTMKKPMRKKLITVVALAGLGAVSFAGVAGAAGPRDGRCVAANLSALHGPTKAAVANGSVDLGVSLSEAIQLHLDGDLDLLSVCG
jgi:hypothetical protein